MKSHLLQLLLPVAQSIHPEILSNSIQLDRPKSIEHGDFSSNLAMALAKTLKKNPRELATLIIEKLPASPFIEKVEIAGAGFINFYLNEKARTFIIHEITPRITFNPFNLIDRVRVGINGDVITICFNKCLIT